jgi:hypothetical protein
MVHVDELQKGEARIQLTPVVEKYATLAPKKRREDPAQAIVLPAVASQQLNLSGFQVLVTLALSLCMVSLFTWAFVRHWLFAP